MSLPNRYCAVFKMGVVTKMTECDWWHVTRCQYLRDTTWHIANLGHAQNMPSYLCSSVVCTVQHAVLIPPLPSGNISHIRLWGQTRAKSECHCHLQTKGSCSYCNPRHPLFMNHYQGLRRDQWIKMIHDNVVNAAGICTLYIDTRLGGWLS